MTKLRKQIFDSMDEMVEACGQAIKEGRSYRDFTGGDWVGRDFTGWEDVAKKVGEYWNEGLDLVQEMLFELRNVTGNARPKSRLRRARWNPDDGDEIDIDRLRSGQDCWRQTVREERDAPQRLCLVFSLCTPSSRDHEDILWRGAVGIILSDLLESLGYRVELWGVNYVTCAYTNYDDGLQAVCLKKSESPVDIASLVNGIAGWFYRTVVFQAYYIEKAKPNSGLGHCETIYDGHPIVEDLAGNAKTIVIDGVWDRKGAEDLVKNVMASLS